MENLNWIEIKDFTAKLISKQVDFSSTRKLSTLAKCQNVCMPVRYHRWYWHVGTGIWKVVLGQ